MSRTSRKDVFNIEKEKKKMGRPVKADEARTAQIHIRLTPTEADRIERCRKALNMTTTELILYGIELIEKSGSLNS